MPRPPKTLSTRITRASSAQSISGNISEEESSIPSVSEFSSEVSRLALTPVTATNIPARPKPVVPRIVLPTTMSKYTNWNYSLTLFSLQRFSTEMDMAKALMASHRIPFHIKARRDETRDVLNGIISEGSTLFSENQRFPEEGALVNLSTGIIADLFDKIMSALDFGERLIGDTTAVSKFGSLDDAKLAYYKGIQRVLDILIKTPDNTKHLYDIYSRDTFEKKFSLKWATPS